ncbi:MAG: HEAT repeat domain-containing protein [Planctomycetota bacterium]|nr:HEAT repeat domain-containing protein [Planctomycetota bacterium]
MRTNKSLCLFLITGLSLSVFSGCEGEKENNKAPSGKKPEIKEEVHYKGKSLEQWIEALKDKDVGVRMNSILAIGEIGPKAEKAVPKLIEALKDKDKLVRGNVTWALGKIGPKAGTISALIEALEDKEWSVRASAAAALGEIGPKAEKAIPKLTETLKDEEPGVCANAKEALEKIKKK